MRIRIHIPDYNCRFFIICKYYQERQVRRQAQYKRKRSESEEEEEDGDDNDPNEVCAFYLSLSMANLKSTIRQIFPKSLDPESESAI